MYYNSNTYTKKDLIFSQTTVTLSKVIKLTGTECNT